VKRPVLIACFVIVMVISACGRENPTPTTVPTLPKTPTSNVVMVTADTTQMSQDLPPTWTPTYTPTITLTFTPSATYSVTPSLTPITIDDMCNDFTYSLPDDSETHNEDDDIKFEYGISETYSYAELGVILEHKDTETVIDDFAAGGTSYRLDLPVVGFPASGRWNYLIGVFVNNDVDIFCAQEGYFLIEEGAVRAEQPNIIPTALPVPSITPQPSAIEETCSTVC
jgi:hypothetical protein